MLFLPSQSITITLILVVSNIVMINSTEMLRISVLIVDDFEPWRRFVRSKLQEQMGWVVVWEAHDGVEAVEKARKLHPDLIMLDIALRKVNGIEAARQIRQLAPNSKILFTSGYRSWDIAEDALRTGALGYVLKLDAGTELLQAVEGSARQAVYQCESGGSPS